MKGRGSKITGVIYDSTKGAAVAGRLAPCLCGVPPPPRLIIGHGGDRKDMRP